MQENKFWSWIITSSQDPNKLATTVKGIFVMFLPLIVVALRYFKIENPDIGSLPEQIQSFLVITFGGIGSLVTAFGLVRKIFLSFQKS